GVRGDLGAVVGALAGRWRGGPQPRARDRLLMPQPGPSIRQALVASPGRGAARAPDQDVVTGLGPLEDSSSVYYPEPPAGGDRRGGGVLHGRLARRGGPEVGRALGPCARDVAVEQVRRPHVAERVEHDRADVRVVALELREQRRHRVALE